MLREKAVRLIRALPKPLGKVKHPLFFLAALLLIAASPVAAMTWDVTADFPGTANPNGVWSYGWENQLGGKENPLGGIFNLFTHLGNNAWQGSPYWNGSDGGDPPIVWKNIGTPQYGVKTGELSLHPGSDTIYTVVRWISPIAGRITINGYFGQGDINSMDCFIYQNNECIWKELDAGRDADVPFSLTRTVTLGTTIDFGVGGHYAYGNTPLHATITENPAMPIPGGVLLLLLGGGE
jgi:hypothetical protein